MEPSTKVIGKMTYNTAMELRLGQMARGMKATTRRGRSMARELISGLMDLVTSVIGLIIKSMGKEFILG